MIRTRSVRRALALLALFGCGENPPARVSTPPPRPAPPPPALIVDAGTGAAVDAAVDAEVPFVSSDPMESHQTTREGLLGLFSIRKENESASATAFLEKTFGPESARTMNQGNRAIARHLIDKKTCLANLEKAGIVVQTKEQRAQCGGFENMVPVWNKGEPPKFCIDVFEFPNRTCELPMVWTPPTSAKKVCELQNKRLCTDLEWNQACKGDPEGGPDSKYAYGAELDLEICHTNLPHRTTCNASGPATAWKTCSTDTEPSGAFPKCRSRFGVFDQHGNVAEVMTRKDGKDTVTQLKGSAWFYVELAKEPGKPPLPSTVFKATAYPDHCNFDPRWHVEPIAAAVHVNYHLGFRCCRSIDSAMLPP